MSKFAKSFRNFFGYDVTEEEGEPREEELYEEEPELEPVAAREERRRERRSSKVVDFPGKSTAHAKIIVYRPVSYEDNRSLVDNLKSNKPIILNMDSIDNATAQRILDFMYGACIALGGDLKKISNRIFAVVPADYELIGNSDGIRE